MEKKITKYTNIISVFFILSAALFMMFKLPKNQITFHELHYLVIVNISISILFILLFVSLFYYVPMFFVIEYQVRFSLPKNMKPIVQVESVSYEYTLFQLDINRRSCVYRC